MGTSRVLFDRVQTGYSVNCSGDTLMATVLVTKSADLMSRGSHPSARRAKTLGFTSTVGILHDGNGQLRALSQDQLAIYKDLLEPDQEMFSFAQYDRFQRNIASRRA
jgi:hypothetical protein